MFLRTAAVGLTCALLLWAANAVALTLDEVARAEVSAGAKPCTFEDAPRPSVIMRPERLAGIKADIDKGGWRAKLFEQRYKKNADLWAGRDIVIPARSGHYHHFFCTDGTLLEVPEDKEFKTTEYVCPACGKTYSGERFDGGRRFLEHRWLYSGCRDLALAYSITGDMRYARKAAEVLTKYADAYPGRHTSATEGGIMYQSLGEAVMMIPLAQAYDMIYDAGVLSEQDKEHIEHDFFWESAAGLIDMGIGGNWGSWHLSAVGVIGAATRHQRLYVYGLESFWEQMDKQLGSDGLWPESVHTYHFYPLRAFIHLAEASANTGLNLYRLNRESGGGLKPMFTQPLYYAYPTGQLPAINDGWFQSYLPPGQYEAAYYRYGMPELAWVIVNAQKRHRRGFPPADARSDFIEPWALVLGLDIKGMVLEPAPRTMDFGNLGVAVLRSKELGREDEQIMVTFDYGRFLGHGQLDKMGVTLFANNRLLAADYGTPGYGSGILPYYKGSVSHNVVVVDGKNQQRTKTGQLDAFCDSALLKAARSTTTEAYPGTTWRRAVLVTDAYVLIVDDLAGGEQHRFDCFFHSEGDSLELAGVKGADGESPLDYAHIEPGAVCVPGERPAATWRFEDGSGLKLLPLAAEKAVLHSARCPAETGARTVPLLVQRKQGKEARFLTLLYPFCGPEQADGLEVLETRGESVVVRCGDAVDTIQTGDTLSLVRRKGEEVLANVIVPSILKAKVTLSKESP